MRALIQGFGKFRRDQRGVSAVEFAFIAPVLILFYFGLAEYTQALMAQRKTINTADRTLAEDSPLQQDLRQTLQELTRTAGSIRVLTDYLERHPESLLRGKPDDKK